MKIECLAGAVCLALVFVSGGQAKSAPLFTAPAQVQSAPAPVFALQPIRDLFRIGGDIVAAGGFTGAAGCAAMQGQTRAYYSLMCFDQALPARLRSR